MKKVTTTHHNCGKCNSKFSVSVVRTETANNVTIDIKRCDVCKYRYGLKELSKEEAKTTIKF